MNDDSTAAIQIYWNNDGNLVTEIIGNPNWKLLGALDAKR